jgi:hypothetical protein
MSRSVQAPRVLNIEDLRRAAKRRLPRVVFDYIDGGAEDEWTLRANSCAFEAVTLRPRCAVAVPSCDLRTVVLGASLPMPLILAPVGSSRSSIRAEKKLPRAPRVRPEFLTYFQLFLAAFWKMSLLHQVHRCGTSFILQADAIARCRHSTERKPQGFLRSLSQSTPRWPACASAIFEMASKNFWAAKCD